MIFAKIDTEANPRLSAAFNVRSIPTLVLMNKTTELARISGALRAPNLTVVRSAITLLNYSSKDINMTERSNIWKGSFIFTKYRNASRHNWSGDVFGGWMIVSRMDLAARFMLNVLVKVVVQRLQLIRIFSCT